MEATEKYVKSKSENPYRFGVLIGNHVEDRFGHELVSKLVFLIIFGEALLFNSLLVS